MEKNYLRKAGLATVLSASMVLGMTATTFAGTTTNEAKPSKTATNVKSPKSDYEEVKAEYLEKKHAYRDAKAAYEAAKEAQAKVETTYNDATKDAAGLNKFYADKVAEAQQNVDAAQAAYNTAKQTATDKKTAYDAAELAASNATAAYVKAANNSSDSKIKAKTAEYTSLVDAYNAAVAKYNERIANANSNMTYIDAIKEDLAKIADNNDKLGTNDTSDTHANATKLYKTYYDKLSAADNDATKIQEAEQWKKDNIDVLVKNNTDLETDITSQEEKMAKESGKYLVPSALKSNSDYTTTLATLGTENTDWVAVDAYSETALNNYSSLQTYKVVNAAGTDTTTTSDTKTVAEWKTARDKASKELDELTKNNANPSSLKADMDTKVAAAATAKTELSDANAAFNTASEKLNKVSATLETLKKEQTDAKDMTGVFDASKASFIGKTGVPLTALKEASAAVDTAKAATEKARNAKNDAFEEYTTYSHIFTRAKKEYQAYKNLKKPVIKVKAGKKCVKVTWKSVKNATKYKVRVKKGNGSYKTYYTTKTKFTVKAKKGTKVKVCVRAQNDAGHSSYSTKKAARAK